MHEKPGHVHPWQLKAGEDAQGNPMCWYQTQKSSESTSNGLNLQKKKYYSTPK